MSYTQIALKSLSLTVVEKVAAGAILPGMLVTEGSAWTVVAQATMSVGVMPLVALENRLAGKGVATAYASGDIVRCAVPQRGDEFALLLKTGENVTKGDPIESGGSGYVQQQDVHSSFSQTRLNSRIGEAMESVNATSAVKQINVRFW